MKAIRINVVEKKVETIEVDGSLQSIYEAIGNNCSTVAVPIIYENGDSLFIDDEGYLKDQVGVFYYPDWHTPISGNALILGCDNDGNSVDCKSNYTEFERRLSFIGKELAEEVRKDIENSSPIIISW